jgi:hypothetical protein
MRANERLTLALACLGEVPGLPVDAIQRTGGPPRDAGMPSRRGRGSTGNASGPGASGSDSPRPPGGWQGHPCNRCRPRHAAPRLLQCLQAGRAAQPVRRLSQSAQ